MKNIIRAVRLPFISASILPFVFGSFIERSNFSILGFLLGFVAVVATHLSANLINDYADSKSGGDWQDKKFYKFFGGSKLIQENVLSEKFYFRLALFFAMLSALSAAILALLLKSFMAFGLYLIIISLSWSYTHKPLKFSYRRMGEVIVFILCGPAPVMGAYFIQTGIFPDFKSFLLSVPMGMLVTLILFANEVPDYTSDIKVGKFTWVSVVGTKRAYLVYYALLGLIMASIGWAIGLGYLHTIAWLSFLAILPAIKAANILKNHYDDKEKLVESSKLSIGIQTLVGLVLIIGVLFLR